MLGFVRFVISPAKETKCGISKLVNVKNQRNTVLNVV